MARDAIDLSKRKPPDASSGETFTVTFLGANDSRIDVPCGSDQYILDAGLDAGLEIRLRVGEGSRRVRRQVRAARRIRAISRIWSSR